LIQDYIELPFLHFLGQAPCACIIGIRAIDLVDLSKNYSNSRKKFV